MVALGSLQLTVALLLHALQPTVAFVVALMAPRHTEAGHAETGRAETGRAETGRAEAAPAETAHAQRRQAHDAPQTGAG
jgi:hypothetical protein